jgi:hypothetical protein
VTLQALTCSSLQLELLCRHVVAQQLLTLEVVVVVLLLLLLLLHSHASHLTCVTPTAVCLCSGKQCWRTAESMDE